MRQKPLFVDLDRARKLTGASIDEIWICVQEGLLTFGVDIETLPRALEFLRSKGERGLPR